MNKPEFEAMADEYLEVRAERDALKAKLDALDCRGDGADAPRRCTEEKPCGRHILTVQCYEARQAWVQERRLVDVLKAKLAALVDYLRDEMATSSKAIPSTADEAIGDAERVLFCQQLLEHEALAAAKVQP